MCKEIRKFVNFELSRLGNKILLVLSREKEKSIGTEREIEWSAVLFLLQAYEKTNISFFIRVDANH